MIGVISGARMTAKSPPRTCEAGIRTFPLYVPGQLFLDLHVREHSLTLGVIVDTTFTPAKSPFAYAASL